MEIGTHQEGETLVVVLHGRLDATWSPAVERALSGAVRAGHHRIEVEMASVDYISSAGLGVLLYAFKELSAIQGKFCVRCPSPQVADVLRLSGLGRILLQTTAGPGSPRPQCEAFGSDSANWEAFACKAAASVQLEGIGEPSPWTAAEGALCAFPTDAVGLGIGAFDETRAAAGPRLGEFLAAAGCAAHLPPGGSNRPDFVVSEGELVPTAWLTSGLLARGDFERLLRFEARAEKRSIGLAELARTCLGRHEAVVILAVAEAAGLVGASLQAAPAQRVEDPFAFPAVRDRLGFTSERAFRDSTVLMVGVVARPGSAWEPWLRPMGDGLFVHAHAAAFPYRPLQKGRIELRETVALLFESKNLQSILHLLHDARVAGGAGESEFYRGAVWVSPVRP
ncbi:MAG: STAS domain-containing protein [Terrimicrobiaceae bacterium]|nr:STAS domain-containing protein [Terrimicrobiaceae bacterium]